MPALPRARPEMAGGEVIAYVFHWWIAALIVAAVPFVILGLLTLSIWLSGRSWRSDS